MLDGPTRCIEVHLQIRLSRVRRPEQVIAGIARYRCVCGVAAGFEDGDDGTVVHDEVAPYLLERVDEIRCRRRCVDGEVRRQVGAMVRWGDGVLVFPALFAGA